MRTTKPRVRVVHELPKEIVSSMLPSGSMFSRTYYYKGCLLHYSRTGIGVNLLIRNALKTERFYQLFSGLYITHTKTRVAHSLISETFSQRMTSATLITPYTIENFIAKLHDENRYGPKYWNLPCS